MKTRWCNQALEEDIKKRGKSWQDIKKEKLWEERRDWRFLIHRSISNVNYNRRTRGEGRRNVTIFFCLSMLNTFGNHMSILFFPFKITHFSSKFYFCSLYGRHKTKITPTFNHLVSKFENGDQFFLKYTHKCNHM
jgi:hypothetical protein